MVMACSMNEFEYGLFYNIKITTSYHNFYTSFFDQRSYEILRHSANCTVYEYLCNKIEHILPCLKTGYLKYQSKITINIDIRVMHRFDLA